MDHTVLRAPASPDWLGGHEGPPRLAGAGQAPSFKAYRPSRAYVATLPDARFACDVKGRVVACSGCRSAAAQRCWPCRADAQGRDVLRGSHRPARRRATRRCPGAVRHPRYTPPRTGVAPRCILSRRGHSPPRQAVTPPGGTADRRRSPVRRHTPRRARSSGTRRPRSRGASAGGDLSPGSRPTTRWSPARR